MKHTGENGYSDSSDDGEAGGTEELKARDQMALGLLQVML